jgi:hypothetical protein
MADFQTPNLCGANESLNTALSKIDDIKAEIESKLNSSASEAAAAFETAQADIKSKLDALAVDLPEAKPVNLQSEITSLINDIDKTTAEGIASFNAKVAELKKDFGGALGDKGLDLDKLIDEGTTKLGKDISAATGALSSAVTDVTGAITDTYSSVTDSLTGGVSNISSGLGLSGVPGNISDAVPSVAAAPTGGNLCDLVPNLELPASAAGTGVTTEEIDDRISNSETLTLSQTPKEILEVQGKKTTQSFFTNIQYTQNGKIIVPKQGGIYDTIKAKYTVSLIKEKPIAAKQADVPAETEEVSTVTKNASIETKKTELKSKVEAVKSGNSFTPTTKSTPIVTPTGKTIKATTSKDAVTTNENGEKIRSTKSADGIAGKYKSVLEVFWSASEFDRYKSGLADKFKKGKGSTLISLDGNSDWEFYILPLKNEPVEIKKIMWAQWTLKSAGSGVGSGDGLVAKMQKTNPLDPNNLSVVNSPSVLIGKTLDFGPNAGSRELKLPIGSPLYIAVRYNILDTTDSNYV